jgi:hypothetical protein
MGNGPSQNQSQSQNMSMNIKNNTQPEILKFNEDEIFEKILNISNQLFEEYNNDFLKEDFCSKIALIYEKKLSNFNIKILKSLYNNINSNSVNREISVTLQYLPKNDEKFIDIADMFKDNLHENFWNKNIEINQSKLITENTKLKKENIDPILAQFNKKYIQFKHVNNLLLSKNKKNNNETNKLTKLVGGFIKKNNKLIKKCNKKGGGNENNNEEEDEEEYEEGNNEGGNNEEGNPTFLNNIVNEDSTNNINNQGNIPFANSNIPFANSNISNSNISFANSNKRNGNQVNIRNSSRVNIVPTNRKNSSRVNIVPTNRRNDFQENIRNGTQLNVVSANSNRRGNSQSTQQFIGPITKQNYNSKQKLNNKTNELIIKNQSNEVPSEVTKDAFVNSLIKYSVPRSYENPINLCKEGEKCKLTKKDLCTAITQNFIVRNNIIAAILTTIPYKNEHGEYEGGVSYQRFLNLEQCKVCVPFEYVSLRNKSIDYILQKILEKADFLDEEKCNNNKGYFLKLTSDQKKILTTKAIESIKNTPSNGKINYNLLFIESSEKLKRTYFESLNSLIQILEKMKETPIINNKTLNLISKETKTYIDNMYNLCYYYYIYGIISLIFAEIKEEIPKENSVGKFITNSIKK